MADLKLSVNFVPEGDAISKLVSQVQSAFGKEIVVKFKADTSGIASNSGAKRDTASILNAYKVMGARYDTKAKRLRSETTEINKRNAALRLQNAEEAKASKVARQSATNERRKRQDELDFKYLKRQSEDYFKT